MDMVGTGNGYAHTPTRTHTQSWAPRMKGCLLHPLQSFNFHNCCCAASSWWNAFRLLFALILQGIHILLLSIVYPLHPIPPPSLPTWSSFVCYWFHWKRSQNVTMPNIRRLSGNCSSYGHISLELLTLEASLMERCGRNRGRERKRDKSCLTTQFICLSWATVATLCGLNNFIL